MSSIKTHKTYCSFCRKDLTDLSYEPYNDLVICYQCKTILIEDNQESETSSIVLFDDIPVLASDAKVLNYFESELSLPLPPITLRNFLTEDEVYGYLIEDNQVVGLGLDGANIESLSAIILNLSNLKFLSLKNNQLRELPNFINNLDKLEIIDLTKNFLTNIPPLSNLSKLNHLSLKDNLLEDFPILPDNLLTINFRWNRIKTIHKSLPKSLKKINLAQNRLQSLSDSLGLLTELEDLNLYGNNLKSLPDCFTSLKNLKNVNLRVNKIYSLPKSMELIPSLEILDVEENDLTNSLNVSNYLNLKVLNISKNQLNEIQGLLNCVELINLDIRDNNFLVLNIDGLNKLQVLDISYNQFTNLPKGIIDKATMVELIASGNKLTDIEKNEIIGLTNLLRLSLAKNEIEKIPDLSSLPNLQELYINDNKMESFPSWLANLNLKVLTIEGNKFKLEEKIIKEKREIDSLNTWFE